ncbi:recombinase family protein [Laribacter hongkongensis]|uniref:recombinase family protein n=1 Tax=Laribacter hongkongensis TaxID=168471 RepID=UPI001EFDECD6|nr:recombinase family protein [Laribacter hongkongensis]MCG9032555.1 recombinase family protein [Laribacter hongkongensis]MCG9091888.1 recombinase family protein [Laribacter hongkongensis]
MKRPSCARFSACTWAGGLGTKAISIDLNARGHARRGDAWTKTTIGAIVTNWVYAGFIVFNRVGHNGDDRPESEWIMTPSHPSIIPELAGPGP